MALVRLAAATNRPKGSAPSRRLRSKGQIPGVLYGAGIEPISLAVDARGLRSALGTGEPSATLLQLDLGESSQIARVHELQYHPVRHTVVHVDFIAAEVTAEPAR
jgi:large subunit ribosomal protein L25